MECQMLIARPPFFRMLTRFFSAKHCFHLLHYYKLLSQNLEIPLAEELASSSFHLGTTGK
jgi:hypothetical protein